MKVHVLQYGKEVVFEHPSQDTSQNALQAVVDHFEGEVGTVLAVYSKDGSQRLYKAPYEALEIKARMGFQS